ncbi:hypothetical protein BDW71DRAFT_190438 [Aspergillus fruticulosus]
MPFYSASTRSFNIPTFLIQFSHLPLYFMYLIGHRSSIEGRGGGGSIQIQDIGSEHPTTSWKPPSPSEPSRPAQNCHSSYVTSSL